MNTFAILYAASSLASIAACLPQIIQIIKTKNVEGISLQTYDMWLLLQIVGIPYTVQSGDPVWACAAVLWLVYYIVMVILIEHYRYPHYIRAVVDKVVAVLRFLPLRSQ